MYQKLEHLSQAIPVGLVDRIPACGPVSPGSIPGRDNFFYIIEDKISLSLWRRQEKVQISDRKMQISNRKTQISNLSFPKMIQET